jgi:hypothetical protein
MVDGDGGSRRARLGDGERGVARSASDFCIPGRLSLSVELPGDLMRRREHRRRPSLPSRQTFEISGGSDRSGQNSGRVRDSLIRAEISLIADLDSLQGPQKIPCSDA